MAIASAAGAFIFLLSKESQTEIGIKDEDELIKSQGFKSRLRIHGNVWASVFLAGLALGSTALFLLQLRSARLMPDDLVAELRDARLEKNSFNVTASLNDYQERFRWLDVNSIKLSFSDDGDFGLNQEEIEADPKDFKFYAIRGFSVKSEDGTVLQQSNFSPVEGPIILKMSF